MHTAGWIPGYVRNSEWTSLHTKFLSRAQAFFNPMAEKWSLESLTIGPLCHKTDHAFWDNAFRNFPTVRHLKELTITYYYPGSGTFDMSCWVFLNSFFCRADIFPHTMRVDVRATIRSSLRSREWQRALTETLYPLTRYRQVTFWGRSEQRSFWSVSSLSPGYHPRLLVVTASTQAVRISPFPRRRLASLVHPDHSGRWDGSLFKH